MPTLPMSDPLQWFDLWMTEARRSSEPEPTAMSLATVDHAGQPTVRIVLLKDFDRKGFVFYTNLKSAKAEQLRDHQRAGLCVMWKTLCRQVRIDGAVEMVDDQQADAYFATRPRNSQIGAWASKQSQPLKSRAELQQAFRQYEERFEGKPVPRPSFWSGYRVVPQTMEFWQIGDYRLHDRWQFQRRADGWERVRLYP